MTHPFLPPDPAEWCCVHCQRASQLRNPPSLPTPEYLAEKARLKVTTSDGELDPRRLHGPGLARWQAAESRRTRGTAPAELRDGAQAAPPGAASPG